MTAPRPVGLKIKRARERLRWSQAQLAAAVGVSQKTIDNWEHDKRYPKSAIGALEDVLGISLDAAAEPEPQRSASRNEAIDIALKVLNDLKQQEQERNEGKDEGEEGGGRTSAAG